jgi:NAD+ synthase
LLATELDIVSAKKKIIAFIKRKVEESDAEGGVIGLSGGIDSAVTAYLAVEALGSRRVMGLIMPDLRATPEKDVSDAKMVASELCVETKEIDIAPIHKAYMKHLPENRLAEGNLRARIRMALLYYHANMMNRLVIGTGDRSESLLGYFTKYGDGGVDILPIADLYKTEVRRLGETLGIRRRIIAKRSSPRLWPGHLAESEIGMEYELVDRIFKMKFEEGMDAQSIAAALKLSRAKLDVILGKYEASEHKRRMPEICKLR